MPNLPEQIDRSAWIDALESVGIPVRNARLARLDTDVDKIDVTYLRTGKSNAFCVAGTDLARITVTVGLAPVHGQIGDVDGIPVVAKRQAQGVTVREVDGGVHLDVPREVYNTLVQFGWLPPQEES